MIETMNYTEPPTVLLGNLNHPTDSHGAPVTSDTIVPTAPARFAVFKQSDAGWVLRDYRAYLDYPFHTKAAAIGGMELRLEGATFLGSPIDLDLYGTPTEAVEVFA